MKLKFLGVIVEPTDEIKTANGLDFSPNGRKLAVGTFDRHVLLFDEKFRRRDKFSTKPCDSKYGKNSYLIKAVKFSPDSTKLAVAQTDCIVFVYKLGDSWGEKKVICNKFTQSTSIMALIWPTENRTIIGLVDGKVRVGECSSNKCSTLYNANSSVVALSNHPNKRSFISGHLDGSIFLYSFESRTQTKLCIHSTVPHCLVFSALGILAAGSDRRIIVYSEHGRSTQNFDYSNDKSEKEFYVSIGDTSGQNVIFGSFNRIRLMSWNQRRGAWDEGPVLSLQNFYTVNAIAWKFDGTTIALGSINGAVIGIDCSLKKSLLKNKFEVIYVGPSQAIIRNISDPLPSSVADPLTASVVEEKQYQQCIIRSKKNYEITDIRIMGRENRYAVGYTIHTLIFTDMTTNLSSEVTWNYSGNEKFYFENENVAYIINAGEISFVEYGRDEVAGWIRTEKVNPHLISVGLKVKQKANKNRSSATLEETRRVAYLLDSKTISILEWQSMIETPSTINGPVGAAKNSNNRQIVQISHGQSIDWLELNESANKLLYRDVRYALYLYHIDVGATSNLINFCSYVQWVPKSDVIVGQSNDTLCVWYNPENVDRVTQFPIQGDVEMVVRDENRTEVIVVENDNKVAYELDSAMIEFGTALEELNLARAVVFLERNEQRGADVSGMWRRLADVAIEQGELIIAQRCFASLNDIVRVRFIQEALLKAEKSLIAAGVDNNMAEIASHFEIKARLAQMKKQFKLAERIYLENNALGEAIEMHQRVGDWEAAIDLARAMNLPNVSELWNKYINYLNETGQHEKAAEIKIRDGDYNSGLDLYLKSGKPAGASKILMEHSHLLKDNELVERVAQALINGEQQEKAGELYNEIQSYDKALDCFCQGKDFNRAIQVAKKHFPEKVVKLENEWGDMLFDEGSYGVAINHFLESGNVMKAVESAMRGKDWEKVDEILNIIEPSEETVDYYSKLAAYLQQEGSYEKAEKAYISANQPDKIVEMYNLAGRWIDAYNVAAEYFGMEDAKNLYLQRARELEDAGRMKEAEDLYITISEPNNAIEMYKNADRPDDMIRLISQFHSDELQNAHKLLAEEFEQKGDLREAEEHYISSGDWDAAIEMYSDAGSWADAHRVAKEQGDEVAQRQIAYLWAKSLGGDSAVKLLTQHNLLDSSITMGTERGDFDFVFDLCRFGASIRLPFVQQKYAEYLEQAGDFERAQNFYLKAGKVQEAITMHLHNKNWDAAEQIAIKEMPDLINEIFIQRAKAALEQNDFKQAESYLLRANEAEMMLTYYKTTNMWSDAIRIAQEYLPRELESVHNEFEEYQLSTGAKGAQSYIAQAKEWERQNEYRRATEAYLRVDGATDDVILVGQCLSKAAELVAKFLPNDGQNGEVIMRIGDRLQQLNQLLPAAEVFLLSNSPGEAVKALVQAKEWAKAKKIAEERALELTSYIDEQYREYLKEQGSVGELIDVDVMSGIDLLVQNSQWEKALNVAKQQNHRPLLDKYLVMYIGELMGHSQFLEAARLIQQFGALENPRNMNIYKKLVDELMSITKQDYEMISILRDIILEFNKQLSNNSQEGLDLQTIKNFKRLECVLHLYALRKALEQVLGSESEEIILKISVSMLRNADILRPDKIFYEAGMVCKKSGEEYENMAFVFLNQYLDVVDAIDEGDLSIVDNGIFQGTDIPISYSLPQDRILLSDEEHDEVKDMVLTMSVSEHIQKVLKTDERGCYEASSIDQNGTVYPTCIITGYPIIGEKDKRELGNGKFCGAYAWMTFMGIVKSNATDELYDVQQFITKWTEH